MCARGRRRHTCGGVRSDRFHDRMRCSAPGVFCLSGSQPSFRPRRGIGAYSVGALQALGRCPGLGGEFPLDLSYGAAAARRGARHHRPPRVICAHPSIYFGRPCISRCAALWRAAFAWVLWARSGSGVLAGHALCARAHDLHFSSQQFMLLHGPFLLAPVLIFCRAPSSLWQGPLGLPAGGRTLR